MGQHKVKQYNREQYLRHNPFCCYCGAKAETTDHIPPRNYFPERAWPEGFEFPACGPCNAETRIDELVVAFILNLRTINNSRSIEDILARSLKAIENNAPEIHRELKEGIPLSASGRKWAFREGFGPLGDELRRNNFGITKIGPLTERALNRFANKVGKSLFYRHTGRILDGYIVSKWNSIYRGPPDALQQRMNDLRKFTDRIEIPERANKPLINQFFYQYRCDLDRGLFFAAITFSEQMMLDLHVLTESALDWAIKEAGQPDAKVQWEIARHPLRFQTFDPEATFPHTDFPRRRE